MRQHSVASGPGVAHPGKLFFFRFIFITFSYEYVQGKRGYTWDMGCQCLSCWIPLELKLQ